MPSTYNLGYDEQQDTGDIPLLRRDPSSVSSVGVPAGPPAPGAYESDEDDAQESSNIRYGRIPQRVPRRYKTIKKFE